MFALAAGRAATTAWDALARELDAWHEAGLRASLWWRDDDATRPGPRLDRLLAIAPGVPRALAVVPERAERALAERLRDRPEVAVLQHGYAHRNHAPAGSRKAELGDDRPVALMLAELGRGRARLAALFGARFRPVLVPPWNRIAAALAGRLPDCGVEALSIYGRARPTHRVPVVNAHADIIDWRGGRGFVGAEAALGRLVAHLEARRLGRDPADLPTGLLTHHRDHDEACWRFVAELLQRTLAHPAAHWIAIPASDAERK